MPTTKHSKKRTKERLGLSKTATDKLAAKALAFGVKHADTKGSLRRYMDRLYLINKVGNNNRIYNRHVYIFRDDLLITVMDLPHQYSELADKLQKG